MIGPDGLPCVAELSDLFCVVPRGDVCRHAFIEQVLREYSVLSQLFEVHLVDLSQADIHGAVLVSSNRQAIAARFGHQDGAQDISIDLVCV